MPRKEDQSILSHASELLHINFRYMRQQIEHEYAHLSSVCASKDTSQDELDEAVSRLDKLSQYIREAKLKHQQLVNKLKARLDYWERYQWDIPAELSDPSSAAAALSDPSSDDILSTDSNDLPVIVPVANYLAERGRFDGAVEKLISVRPDIVQYLDLDAIAEEKDLLRKFDQQDYISILKWCKKHRSSIRKATLDISRIEVQIQIREYVRLALLDKPEEAIEFGRKAFMNSVTMIGEYTIIENAAELLYRGPPLGFHGSKDELNSYFLQSCPSLIHYAQTRKLLSANTRQLLQDTVRDVYQRPRQSPLINNVLLGAAALKTRQCAPGSRGGRPVDITEKVCPLCRSKRMRKLFFNVPFALHGRSKTDSDLLMFPSGAVATHESIVKVCEMQGCPEGVCKDPRSNKEVRLKDLKTVYAL